MKDNNIQQILEKLFAEGIQLKEPLVELTFPEVNTVEAGDFEGFDLAVWNRSAQRLTVPGDNVAPDDYLMLSVVSGEELDRAMRTFIAQQGGESHA